MSKHVIPPKAQKEMLLRRTKAEKLSKEQRIRYAAGNEGRRRLQVRVWMEALPAGHRLEVKDPQLYIKAKNAVKNLNKLHKGKRRYGSITEHDGKTYIFRLK